MKFHYHKTNKKIDCYYPQLNEVKNQKPLEVLPKGVYYFNMEESMFGVTLELVPIEEKELLSGYIPISGGVFKEASDFILNFFDKKKLNVFNQLKFKMKAGCIFHGRPGTGKTTLIYRIMYDFIAQIPLGYCFILSDFSEKILYYYKHFMDNFRSEKNPVPVITFLDELESHVPVNQKYVAGTEEYNATANVPAHILNFLDGSESITNSLFLTTTNCLDKFNRKLTERSSRFAKKFHINSIPKEVAHRFILDLIPKKLACKLDAKQLAYKLSESDLQIDCVNHVVLSILTENKTIDEAISDLKANMINKSS